MKTKPKPTLTETLKAAIERSGASRYRIAQEAGVLQTSISRFMSGETSLRLDMADRLAAYLGLYLATNPDVAPPEPTPENLARPMLAKRKRNRKARR
jgi:transcriptional regulator with XRE-family HTH domain